MIQIDMQMPERCGVCFAIHTDEIGLESWCGIDETARDLYTEEINTKRPDWCPMKEQELVRCKDCEKKGNSYLCRLDRDLEEYGSHRTDAYDDWFCADGKRKSD